MSAMVLAQEGEPDQRYCLEGRVERHETLEKIIFAQEIEKKKLALELHDGVTQMLACIHYRIHACARLLPKNSWKAQRELREIERLAAESMVEARALLDSLRPPVLDDIGLIPAIRRYLERSQLACSLTVDLVLGGPVPRMSYHAETAIYRIVQEAVFNISRHARASHAEVKVACEAGMLQLEISDNGQGFDPEAVNKDGDNWGLIGMRERAEILGGAFKIVSAPGQGTTVLVKLPVSS